MRQGKHRPHYATARSRRSLRRRREVGLPGMIATLLLALAALLPNVVMAIMVGQMAGSVAYFFGATAHGGGAVASAIAVFASAGVVAA